MSKLLDAMTIEDFKKINADLLAALQIHHQFHLGDEEYQANPLSKLTEDAIEAAVKLGA